MGWLPQKVSQYFETACHGLSFLLPEIRQANQAFLIQVYEALQGEEEFTAYDIDHLETLMRLADRLPLPTWKDSKSLIEAEAYLFRQLPDIHPDAIRYCLEYMYHLLQRHGRIGSEAEITRWRLIRRTVQRFNGREQILVNDFIDWMLKNQFSAASILDRIRELLKFRDWMEAQGIQDIDEITEAKALQYLYERGRTYQVNTSQKIGVHLQAFFEYYRERVNPLFPRFLLARFRSLSGHGATANSKEIQALWSALKGGALEAESALMLLLVIGTGFQLKILPLLRLTDCPGKLVYSFQKPNRQGIHEYEIALPMDDPWIEAYWTANLRMRSVPADFPYLFVSPSSIKRRQPISTEYCRKKLQGLITGLLGYPIAVNRLERGSLKALAAMRSYDKFMERVQNVPLSNRTKLFIWLSGNRKLAPSVRRQPKTRLKPTGTKTRQGSSVLMGRGVGVEISTTSAAETAPSTNSSFHKIEVFNS
jgi:site-specific recombinase XerD